MKGNQENCPINRILQSAIVYRDCLCTVLITGRKEYLNRANLLALIVLEDIIFGLLVYKQTKIKISSGKDDCNFLLIFHYGGSRVCLLFSQLSVMKN